MTINALLDGIFRSLAYFLPELVLTAGFVLLILAEIFLKNHPKRQQMLWLLALMLVLVTLFLASKQWQANPHFMFSRLLYVDNKAVFFKVIILVAALLLLLSVGWRSAHPPEFMSILPAFLLGLCLMTMAVNLLSIYLSIEVVSVCSYIFTAFSPTRKASEGALKYLLFGALSSGVMLYGMSLCYGMAATLDITSDVFAQRLGQNGSFPLFVAGLLTLSGLFFKLSLVPFHVWTPDVYEAVPAPVAAFFSVAPKAAALLILMRLAMALPPSFQLLLAAVALTSILVGNLSALWQTNAQRMLAYSTVAQAGFMLVGVVALNETGLRAASFYVATFLFFNWTVFLLIEWLAPDGRLASFAGLGWQHKIAGVALTVAVLALVGLPPTSGFMGKLLVFSGLWEAYQTSQNTLLLVLLLVGLLNAVISLFYYLKIPFMLYFREADKKTGTPQLTVYQQIIVVVLMIPTLLFFFKSDWLVAFIDAL